MPRKSPFKVELSQQERQHLEDLSARYTAPYFQVVRAKVVLMAADGLDNKEIGARLDLPRQVVSKWRKRFFKKRLLGLDDLPRRGRPPSFPPSGRR